MSYITINQDSDEDESFSFPSSSSRDPQELSRLITDRGPSISGMSNFNPSQSPPPRSSKQAYCDVKTVAFFGVGIVTLLYCILELGVGGYIHSLALLADGFHNLSDVVSLIIANWANQATKRPSTFDMSFGWARSEILGGLINAVFLLALCLYTSLEALFDFVSPTPMTAGWWYIGVAGLGVAINTFGTVIFCLTGNAHGHSHGGHGHSHGGDDHGHGHGHGDKKKDKHGHGHGHGDKKKEKHGHGHGHGDKKKEKHGHGHGHGEKKEKHGHGHGEKKEKHGHGHGHGEKKEKKVRRDENVYAVFIHYLGDMISSLLVLAAGLLIHFLSDKDFQKACFETHNQTETVTCTFSNVSTIDSSKDCCELIPTQWTDYLDPITSLLIVALILYTSLPVVLRCVWILLQRAPEQMNIADIRQEILMLDGVVSIHDLHIWQLVDGMVFCSAHVQVQEGSNWTYVVTSIREILHKHGVHSSSIQPEFLPAGGQAGDFCEQNCVEECDEDWCCKNPAESHKENTLEDVHSH